MATILKIDETLGLDANTNDTSATRPTILTTRLNTIFGNTTWPSSIIQTAEKIGALTDFGSNAIDVAFTEADGDPLVAVDSGLTAISGRKIFLYSDSGTGSTNNLVFGREANADGTANSTGAIAFIVYLETNGTGPQGDANATSADLWVIEFTTVQHYLNGDPANLAFNNHNDFVALADKLHVSVANPIDFSLEGAPSGQNLFLMFGDGSPGVDENGDPDPDEVAIIVTASNAANVSEGESLTSGGTVNTGQGGGGTTLGHTNQMVDPPEGANPAETLVFSFVQGANVGTTVPNLDQNEADLESNINFDNFFQTTSASFTIVQLQPPKASTLKISAGLANLNPNGTADPGNDTPWEQDDYIDHQLDFGAVNIDNVTLTRSVTVRKVTTVYTVTYDEDGAPTGLKKVGSAQPVAMTAAEITALGLTVSFGGSDAIIRGVITGDNFKYVTDSGHDRALITNVGDPNPNFNSPFDIGSFRIESGGITTSPLDNIEFYDDGPTITAVTNTQTVIHDETPGLQNATDTPAVAGDADDKDVAGTAFVSGGAGATVASLFANVPSPGDDAHVADNPIGYARSGGALVTVTDGNAGRDGAASQELTYGISTVDRTDSGVETTSGTKIFMYNGTGPAAGLILGRVGTENAAGDTANDTGTVAFALAVNPLNGEVFQVQYLSLRHLTGGPSHDDSLSLANGAVQMSVRRSDIEGDFATDSDNNIGLQIRFEDDGPSITAETNGNSVTHDETPGVDSTDVAGTAFVNNVSGANVASLFSSVPAPGDDPHVADNPIGYARSVNALVTATGGNDGADGPATQELTYGISVVNETYSGVETTGGTKIFMYNGSGGLVLGRVGSENGANDTANANGTVAFALAVNPLNGEVFQVQYLSLMHPTGGTSYDEPISLDAGAVQMSVTRTDGDGDTATDTDNNIGLQVKFEDDGPTITAVTNSNSVTHDETAGVDSDTDVVGTAFVSGGSGATVAGLFTNVPSPGEDTDVSGTGAIGFARSVNALVTVTGGNAGADGPASQQLTYGISVVNDTYSGVETSEGTRIFMYNGTGPAAGLVLGRVGLENVGGDTPDPAGAVAFALAVNPLNGEVFQAQYLSLLHQTGGLSSFDESISLDAGAVQMSVTRTDGDTDTATDSDNNIGLQVKFEDDGPDANGTPVSATVDEDGTPLLAGANTNAAPGDSNAGTTATGSIAGIFNTGSDGLKEFSLSTVTSGLAQNLKSQGGTVLYDVTGNLLTAYVEVSDATGAGYNATDDREVFTLELSGANNGTYTFTMIDQLDHPLINDPSTAGVTEILFEDDLVLDLGSVLRITDKDNDTKVADPADLQITVDDDSPSINGSTNIVYANSLNGTGGGDIGGTGTFDYSIGVDDRDAPGYSVTSSDLIVSLLSTSNVGGTEVTSRVVTWSSENDTTAVFNIGFTYVSNPTTGGTSNASGTITFNKANDTYTVKLNQEIASFSVLTLADAGVGFKGYLFDSTTPDTGIPAVTTAQLAGSFFVQFRGFAEPSGNGTDSGTAIAGNGNLDALALTDSWAHNDDDLFADGELFTLFKAAPNPSDPPVLNPAGVSISGSSAGTNSDTMQSGEVLDFTLYSGDPKGQLNPPAGVSKTTAGTIFIEFDQLSFNTGKQTGEDMVIVLKLVDANNPNITTTRAIIVEATDIYHAGDTLPAGFGFTAPLTGDNGMVIIEQQDYDFGGTDNWVIQGAQVLASSEGVTSTSAIDLNRAVGTGGASTQAGPGLSGTADSGNGTTSTWDSDVFKIVNIGFVTNQTPDSLLNFGVQVVDFDGDTTASQTLAVRIEGDSAFGTTSSSDTISMRDLPADLDLSLVAESRSIAGFDPIAPDADVFDFTTDAVAGNFESGAGSFASLAAYITEAGDQLDGTTRYYFGTIGSDGYLAYDEDGTGFTAIIKLAGVTTNFDHTDIF